MPLVPTPAPEELIWRVGAPYICTASLFWFLASDGEDGVMIYVQKPDGYRHTIGRISKTGLDLFIGDWDSFGIPHDNHGYPRVVNQ